MRGPWQTVRRLLPVAPFALWLLGFYATWLTVVVGQQAWDTVLSHWPIALAMLVGSFLAGSTPMGGGTVGYPVLVLLLGKAPTIGRDFSFAIQSIGMTSAAIYILCTRKPAAFHVLISACIGSAVGTPLGILFVAPYVPERFITVLFSAIWASFGILAIWRNDTFSQSRSPSAGNVPLDRWLGALIGFCGGMFVASVTGVGLEMLIFCALVLMRGADVRTAIPTGVMLMAFTSVIGLATKVATADLQPELFGPWLAASPIVVLGAPLGAFVAARVARRLLLYLVSYLCIAQFIVAYWRHWPYLGWPGLLSGTIGVVAFHFLFRGLDRLGQRFSANQLPSRHPS